MIYKTLYRKLKIVQNEGKNRDDVGCSGRVCSSCSTVVAPGVLLLLKIQ